MISPRNVNLFTQLPCTTWIPITLMCTWISAFCNNYGSYLIMIWPASVPPKHTFPHVQPRKSSLKDQCCVRRLYITVLMSTTRFTIVEFSVDPTYLIFSWSQCYQTGLVSSLWNPVQEAMTTNRYFVTKSDTSAMSHSITFIRSLQQFRTDHIFYLKTNDLHYSHDCNDSTNVAFMPAC